MNVTELIERLRSLDKPRSLTDWETVGDVAGAAADALEAMEKRLAEAEHLILRMAGEDYQRARFYVEKYDLTGERAADSASAQESESHE